MTRDEAINEHERLERVGDALAELHRHAGKLQGDYAGPVGKLLRRLDDELANELPGEETFPLTVGDTFQDVERMDQFETYRVIEADEKRAVLQFPNGCANTCEYRMAFFDTAKQRGWLAREDLAAVGLLYVG